MNGITITVYYDWDKPHTVIRPEKPHDTARELLIKLAKGSIVGFDITLVEYIHGKRIRKSTAYRIDGDCNAVLPIPF